MALIRSLSEAALRYDIYITSPSNLIFSRERERESTPMYSSIIYASNSNTEHFTTYSLRHRIASEALSIYLIYITIWLYNLERFNTMSTKVWQNKTVVLRIMPTFKLSTIPKLPIFITPLNMFMISGLAYGLFWNYPLYLGWIDRRRLE